MTATLDPGYVPLQPYGGDMGEVDELPHDDNMIVNVVPESSRARWNHIEDLDSFFIRMYLYQQGHGFRCILAKMVFELMQFVFVIGLATYVTHCIDYPVLFRYSVPPGQKVHMGDVLKLPGKCVSGLGLFAWFFLIMAAMFFIFRVIKAVRHAADFYDMKQFYNSALQIPDDELDNMTWHDIMKRVREAQKEQQMCIHKQELSELDIYHRILRSKNYMVAMINKNLIPTKFQIPFIGETTILTSGYKLNLELILIWGPFSPFENSWQLKDEYKKGANRQYLAQKLARYITLAALLNFLLCPLVFMWQLLISFFSYAEVIKRDPGAMGLRSWSLYGKYYLRHFNELDHELLARLNRAYRPATKYMNTFNSPMMTIISKNIMFMAGSVLGVLILLMLYDEDVLLCENYLSTMTILGSLVAVCRACIPDENLVFCPEKLMTAVLAQVHYLPDSWRGQAHTRRVREEFAHLFQYKAVLLLMEVLSPLITPIVLYWSLRPRALDIVDFLRNFTVEVLGVGDVCSFAQMDVRKHGNPTWQTDARTEPQQTNQYTQAEDGKTELSLIHFTLTNPEWRPPADAECFVNALREQAKRDAKLGRDLPTDSALYPSLHSLSSIGIGDSSAMANFLRGNLDIPLASLHYPPNIIDPACSFAVRGGLSRAEGPVHSDKGLLFSMNQAVGSPVPGCSEILPNSEMLEDTATNMSLSTLYLHELHHRQVKRRGNQEISMSHSLWQHPHQDIPESSEDPQTTSRRSERTPLLDPAVRPLRPS